MVQRWLRHVSEKRWPPARSISRSGILRSLSPQRRRGAEKNSIIIARAAMELFPPEPTLTAGPMVRWPDLPMIRFFSIHFGYNAELRPAHRCRSAYARSFFFY